jgi:hypothetical protein
MKEGGLRFTCDKDDEDETREIVGRLIHSYTLSKWLGGGTVARQPRRAGTAIHAGYERYG